ncbi:oxidase [Dictyobacter alpinus]|uniref:Oxidase n=1 Tax=Dictyobacter alpinus TaxID=2014873 RepID=A0A402BCM6_9CHLR|nr:aromatic ring-hydroxylating dioxygenase subunit alpha [Dictyobacter alpinus]GCE29099.1 oxidase [Dictyobacter alpinus]
MIPNMWYAVLESSEVKPGKPYAFTRLNEDLVFWRDKANKIVVMRDRCPHRRSKLSPGKIVDGNIQCHFHGFQYDRNGECQLIPANGRTGPRPKVFQCTTYPSQEAHGFIWAWYGEPRKEYPPLPFFDDLDGFVYSTAQKLWDVHYTRAIEGALDVSHLPFVHAKTIGRGGQTLVNGPYTTLEDNKIRVWVSNQPDQGLPAIKPTQVPPPEGPAGLWFNFPNVWQLYLGKDIRNVLIFAPVDDDHVMIYLRAYQNKLKLPLLGKGLTFLTNLANKYILNEDYAITRTQHPKKASLNIGEHFIPGDRPIALYLRQRRDLILAATGENPIEDAQEQQVEESLT